MRLIDADALPREKMLAARGNGQYEDVDIVYGDDIDNAPTIDPVRHGKWINESEEDECHNVECECSLCHHKDIHAVSAIVPYCWHCGAKMDGGSDDEQQG